MRTENVIKRVHISVIAVLLLFSACQMPAKADFAATVSALTAQTAAPPGVASTPVVNASGGLQPISPENLTATGMAAPSSLCQPSGKEAADLSPVSTGGWDVGGQPQRIATGPGGEVFVTVNNNYHVVKYSSSGQLLAEWDVGGQPTAIAAGPGGEVYVNVTNNHRVVKYSSSGQLLAEWDMGGQPAAIAAGPGGEVFVTVNNNYHVVKYSSDGECLALWDVGGQPVDLATGPGGEVFVTITNNHRVIAASWEGEVAAKSPPEAASGSAFTVEFWAAPPYINEGECTTLNWKVSGAQAVTYEGGTANMSGSQSECPAESRDYQLQVVEMDGSTTDYWVSVEVYEVDEPLPPTKTPTNTSPPPPPEPPTDTPTPTEEPPPADTAGPSINWTGLVWEDCRAFGQAEVTDESGVSQATFYYNKNGEGWNGVWMQEISTDLWESEVGVPVDDGTGTPEGTLEYYVVASDTLGNESESATTTYEYVGCGGGEY